MGQHRGQQRGEWTHDVDVACRAAARRWLRAHTPKRGEELEDTVQEAVIRVATAVQGGKTIESLPAFAAEVARRVALEQHRDREPAIAVRVEALVAAEASELGEDEAPEVVEERGLAEVTDDQLATGGARLAANQLGALLGRRWTEADSDAVRRSAELSRDLAAERGQVGVLVDRAPDGTPIYLHPRVTRRPRDTDWRSFALAVGLLVDFVGTGRRATAREIALAAYACGWAVLTRDGLDRKRHPFVTAADTVDDALARSAALGIRAGWERLARERAEQGRGPQPGNELVLPLVLPVRRGR